MSKDRALQLDATINSLLRHCRDLHSAAVKVLYTTSTQAHEERYRSLVSHYSDCSFISFIREIDFRSQILSFLAESPFILFLVDDSLCVDSFHLADAVILLNAQYDALGLSLRLGKNSTHCYPINAPQRLPLFEAVGQGVHRFDWRSGQHDFCYPLEVSSSLYRRSDLLPLLFSASFQKPNSLEDALARCAGAFAWDKPYLLCYETSRTFCAPINMVQVEIPSNRAGKMNDYAPETLGLHFDRGERIDVSAYDGFVPDSSHQEIELKFMIKNAKRPAVSVIIPCYNQAEFLADAVRSIVRQTFTGWECIIVNDGSEDETSTLTRSLIAAHPDHTIRLIEKENGGVADARNSGIAAARGEWILALDSDDQFLPSFLKKAMSIIRGDDSVDIVFANVRQFGACSGSWIPAEYSDELILRENCIPYAALYRKKLWEKGGGYHRVLGKANLLEDWEFWIRISTLHPRVVRIPQLLFRYRIHDNNTYYSVIKPNFEIVHAMIQTADPTLYPREDMMTAWSRIAASPPELRRKIQETLERYPEESLPYFWRGLIHENDGRRDLAMDDYLQAKKYATTKEWQLTYCIENGRSRPSALLKPPTTPVPAQQTLPKSYSSMSVDGETQFEMELRAIFRELRPSSIIETGTYLGQGTSSIIWRALRDFGIDAEFTTIEVNPRHHQLAVAHFAAQGMKIRAELGVSVPRGLLPDRNQIADKFIVRKEYDGIYYDHDESVRAELYFAETDFKVADDLLFAAMGRCRFKPEFVLLDSAGHMGFIEFQYFMSLIKGDCILMLDDVYHCKHFKTLQVIKKDPRFEILVESREKFGFCIARYTHVKSLLLVRTDLIGDNILASAMLPPLREKYPDAAMTVLCQERIAELYAASPLVQRIISFDLERIYEEEPYRESIIQQIRDLHADLCLNGVFSRTPLSDLLAVASGARITVAQEGDLFNISAETRARNNGYYTHLLPNGGDEKSELQRHRDLLAGIGIESGELELPFWALPEDLESVEQLFRDSGFIPEKTITLFAGAQDGIKRYEGYGAALAGICREQGFTVIALGAKKDYAINQRNLDAIGVQTLNLSGATTLRQSGVIISRCRLAVGADTGLAHIACAVGTPNVVLLGGWHWGRFFPYSPLTSVVSLTLDCFGCDGRCRYAKAHCIGGVAPETMGEAIRRTLAGPSPAARLFAQGNSLWRPKGNEPSWVPAEKILNNRNAIEPKCTLLYV